MLAIAPKFVDSTRVWIYQSDRQLTASEAGQIGELLAKFVNSWSAHGSALVAFGEVYAQRFIILGVDELRAGASGCSIDKSTHFVESLELSFGIGLFDRMTFAWLDADGIQTASAHVFTEKYRAGTLTPETVVFDNLVPTLGELRNGWQKPLAESWHKRFV